MPEIGEIRRAAEIGKRHISHRYIWAACVDCGKERWVTVAKGKPVSQRCLQCQAKTIHMKGERHIRWRGGRAKTTAGYVLIWVSPDDFFFPMADSHSYIREHRLVMAQHLTRCLLPWEVVHHKNGVKNDNRLKNLELLPSLKHHLVDAKTKAYIQKLEREIVQLKDSAIPRTEVLRQVVEWGNSDCPHVSHSRGKHWCEECWQSLQQAIGEE